MENNGEKRTGLEWRGDKSNELDMSAWRGNHYYNDYKGMNKNHLNISLKSYFFLTVQYRGVDQISYLGSIRLDFHIVAFSNCVKLQRKFKGI